MNQGNATHTASLGQKLYKVFIYFVLALLAVVIIVPVAWVFMASIKQNSEFYGNPWALPKGVYWQNFVDAWSGAKMGEYMLNSVFVTALALIILLVVALPGCLLPGCVEIQRQKILKTWHLWLDFVYQCKLHCSADFLNAS